MQGGNFPPKTDCDIILYANSDRMKMQLSTSLTLFSLFFVASSAASVSKESRIIYPKSRLRPGRAATTTTTEEPEAERQDLDQARIFEHRDDGEEGKHAQSHHDARHHHSINLVAFRWSEFGNIILFASLLLVAAFMKVKEHFSRIPRPKNKYRLACITCPA